MGSDVETGATRETGTTGHQRTGPDRRPDRRTVLSFAVGAATAGMGIGGWPVTVQAQTALVQRVPSPVPPIDEAALLANLFTRMATATQVNGRSGLSFVLDTGAGRTAIAEDVALALGLPAGPQILVHGITSAAVTPTVDIARLGFGGRRFNDLQAGVYPRDLLGADGLLGLDVLAGFEVEFDMTGRSIHLRPSGHGAVYLDTRGAGRASRLSDATCGRTRTGRFGQLILLNARAAGIPVECFVDSGAQYSIGNLALREAVVAREGEPVPRPPVQVFGVTGQNRLAERGDVSQLEINSHRLGPTPMLFADLHVFEALDMTRKPALLLGADILSRFQSVSLDFGRGSMSFNGLRRQIAPLTRL